MDYVPNIINEEDQEKGDLIHIIIDNIYKNKNVSIKCKILNDKKENDFIFMTINLYNIDYTQFVRKKDNINLENKDITFEIKDIKLMTIKGKYYFYIEKYEILKHETYKLDEAYIFNSIKEIKDDSYLYTMRLKAKEILGDLENAKFSFQDINSNTIKIDFNEKYKFENGKIYLFNGYFFDKSQKQFRPTMISSIQEYSNDRNELMTFKDIDNLEKNKLVNFKGKIKSFSSVNNSIIVNNEDETNYKIKVNYSLLKKISINGICYFFNFLKRNDDEFEATNFSDIEIKEETSIKFIFDDFNINKNLYNRIKINKKYYDIDKKIMNIKIKDKNKKNIFNQNITYERIENGVSIDSHKFSLEVEKGKINHFQSLLGDKGNHSYQFYFQARFPEDLPKSIPININNITFDYNITDKFDNNLIERFTIINIPEQDVSKLLQIPIKKIHENFKGKKISDWKYLIYINDKHEKDYQIFMKKKYNDRKKYFEIEKNDFQIIETIFNENINKKIINDIKKVLLPFVVLKKKEEIYNIFNIFNEGFKKYRFKNKRQDYESIKYLSFIFLFSKCGNLTNKNYISSYYENFRKILYSIINLEYIDRIKVLLGFISYFNDSIKTLDKKKPTIEQIVLYDIDNNESEVEYPYIKQAYGILFEIIDNMKEDCPLYQGIFNLNSIIYKDITNNINFHSGSLLNVNDIKLELIKNINRFLFLSFKENYNIEDYAEYYPESKTTVIYLLTFFENPEDIYNKKYFGNATSAILILLIHKILGHGKKDINNETILTPRYHNDNNFQILSLREKDSGAVLEYLFIKNCFKLEDLMMNDDSVKLLNFNLYIDKNFDDLRKIYKKIRGNIEEEERKEEKEEEKKEEKKEERKEEKKGEKKGEKEEEEEKEEEKEEEEKEKEEEEEELIYPEIIAEGLEIINKEETQNKFIEQEEIKDEENNYIYEELKRFLFKEQNVDNISQNKKKLEEKTKNDQVSPPKQKRLMYRELRRIYGKITKEQEKNLKDDENYKRYLKIRKNKRVKY